MLASLICWSVRVLGYLVLARLLLSWFPRASTGSFAVVVELIERSTEWILGPARKMIPPIRAGAGLIDVSGLVVLLALQLFIGPLVCQVASSLV